MRRQNIHHHALRGLGQSLTGMALQQQDATLGPALRSGHYAPLKSALGHAIWQHGRRFGREELLMRSTGRGLDPAPYLAYLQTKYSPGTAHQ